MKRNQSIEYPEGKYNINVTKTNYKYKWKRKAKKTFENVITFFVLVSFLSKAPVIDKGNHISFCAVRAGSCIQDTHYISFDI